MTPLLVGPLEQFFAVEISPGSERAGAVGVIVAVHGSSTQNPVGVMLGRSLAAVGHRVVVMDHPGQGLSYESDGVGELGTALEACAAHLQARGMTRVGLVIGPEVLWEAVRYAVDDERVFGVASASLPAPEREVHIEQVSFSTLKQRGIGEVVTLLKDPERRRRYWTAAMKKARLFARPKRPDTEMGSGQGTMAPELKAALEAGLDVLVVGGRKDKTSRLMRRLGQDPSTDKLTVDFVFEGRMATFDTHAAQVAFVDSVTRWFDSRPADL